MKTLLLFAFALSAPLLLTSLKAADSLQETRNVLEQWVETRQITSKERSDWLLEESILKDTSAF